MRTHDRGRAFDVAARLVVLAGTFASIRASSAAQDASSLTLPPGFSIAVIAHVRAARELAAAPNGDLLVGTNGRDVVLVPGADGTPGPPHAFVRLDDGHAAGVALAGDWLYIGSLHGVWRVPYHPGDTTARAAPQRLAAVRTIVDGGHSTTSVAVSGNVLYASVGSSCNACVESDPTRATIQQLALDGSGMHPAALNIRNAIALAVDPASGALWAGVAGQDELEPGHPYEIFDDVGAHGGTPDYGWPYCYENRRPAHPGRSCAAAVVARVVFPAYETPIGAAFYPERPSGGHPFPAPYRGGAFVSLHGSWHQPPVAPRVVFVPMHGDEPVTAVNWRDPSTQWTPFVEGFQAVDGTRIGRPTGVAVGAGGSLFVADDEAGVVYRIRATGR
jgi:glucose/arabinose dehydrogenase